MIMPECLTLGVCSPDDAPILPPDKIVKDESQRTADQAQECLTREGYVLSECGPGVVPWFIRSVGHGW